MDWSQSVSGAISGGLGLLGSYLNYKYNDRLTDKQNQYNLQMWNLQNEYNSPSAQMRRYQEAGLNPALMYGQVTPGNATSAPAQHVPNAPDFRELRELGKAFNIEGLKQAIAETKIKQAEARGAKIAADQAQDEYKARRSFGHEYTFDPSTGGFVRTGNYVDEDNYVNYVRMKELSNNFRTNSLIVPRGRLIGSQIGLNTKRGLYTEAQYDYLKERQKMLAPQLRMLNYQADHFPATFWIGTAARGAQAVSPFLPLIF